VTTALITSGKAVFRRVGLFTADPTFMYYEL